MAVRKAAAKRAPRRATAKAGAKKQTRARRRAGAPADLSKAQAKVLAWFGEHGRSFPWRDTRDPYRILVAESMLQQTQTGRVVPTYGEFLQHFPTVDRLAHAPSMEVIRAWRGLGFNRRAVDLHQAAQAVEHDHGGVFPREPRVLKRLPGVGEYTANALACFAFDRQVPVVDTNVRRVLARAAAGKEPEAIPLADAARLASEWLPPGEAYRWNQALMDVGAMVCRHEHPLCAKCPLKAACAYYARGLNRKARAPAPPKQGPFEGSNRQARGGIVDHLREAASGGITLAALARAIHPGRTERDLSWLVDLLGGLARDGLVEMTPAALRGSPRGVVRLPG